MPSAPPDAWSSSPGRSAGIRRPWSFRSDRFPDQVRRSLENVVVALAAAGARPDQITRLTWYVTDRDVYLSHQREIGACYREIIGRHFPAMSVVVVRGLIESRAQVEIEATAVIPV